MQNYRKQAFKHYGLDPKFYYTMFALSCDRFLKISKSTLELICSAMFDVYEYVNELKRGGLSGTGNIRHCKSNKKYMNNYYKTKDSTFICYYDITSMYDAVMGQYRLPYGNFRWLNNYGINGLDLMSVNKDSYKGYILTVDLEY